ncbi:unnamed protein product [Triticum turgidum subsp. durum]|uniref:Chalcone/stilbene synthase C-terminal domain-containing protein n=1 Tax=Triticum turgidum subsp. durum TaxID=4567 RepID=A0A9R0Z3T2_TRITD|nr:unnamed protein product [Triticum turgidum subsp. durum]
MANAREIRRLQRADGPAAVLAIGTANPQHRLSQDEYPEYYFRVTNSEHLAEQQMVTAELKTCGLDGNVSTKLPNLVADNIKQCLLDVFSPLGIEVKWNDLFWAVHPGAMAILDKIERVLLLEPGKLMASRTVAREYGNMLSATIIFVLDEQRRRMEEEGEWAEWGAMVGFGPGFTMETMVLQATSNLKKIN